MSIGDKIRIELRVSDIGQLLDGLRMRLDAWTATAEYWDCDGYVADDGVAIEECTDAHEAHTMVDTYARIINEIVQQLGD